LLCLLSVTHRLRWRKTRALIVHYALDGWGKAEHSHQSIKLRDGIEEHGIVKWTETMSEMAREMSK